MYQFIIVYVVTVKYVLHFYIYRGVEGKKGGNSVVLFVMNDFKDMGYFLGPTFLEITTCSNNYAREKNKD